MANGDRIIAILSNEEPQESEYVQLSERAPPLIPLLIERSFEAKGFSFLAQADLYMCGDIRFRSQVLLEIPHILCGVAAIPDQKASQ